MSMPTIIHVCGVAALTILMALGSGCESSPRFPQEELAERQLFLNTINGKFARESSTCKSPAAPTGLTDGQNWRYGCFCGGNYPLFDVSLSGSSLIERYYETKPKDLIDSVCRDHDVCYVQFGYGDGACNQIMSHRLDDLFDAYMEERKKLPEKIDGKRPFSACTQTILDIGTVFLTAFAPNTYPSWLEGLAGRFSRWVFATPLLSAIALAFSSGAEYPGANELCNGPSDPPITGLTDG